MKDVVPMAIPSFGGMTIVIRTMFIVPTLYCSVQEWKLKLDTEDPRSAQHTTVNSANFFSNLVDRVSLLF